MSKNSEYRKEYRRTHPEYRKKQKIYKAKYYDTHYGRKRVENRSYHARNKRRYSEDNQRLKREVLRYYGVGGVAQCKCCGEKIIEFLTLDHIRGDGAQHKREYSSKNLYKWIRSHNFPIGFRTLCWNCNCSLGKFGYCPHGNVKVEKEIIEEIPPLFAYFS